MNRNITYISGPAGCGKTTVLTAYCLREGVRLATLDDLGTPGLIQRLLGADSFSVFAFDNVQGPEQLQAIEKLAADYPALYFVVAGEI